MTKKLADKKWVSVKLEEIGEQISHFEEKSKEYNELLKVLLVSKDTGKLLFGRLDEKTRIDD